MMDIDHGKYYLLDDVATFVWDRLAEAHAGGGSRQRPVRTLRRDPGALRRRRAPVPERASREGARRSPLGVSFRVLGPCSRPRRSSGSRSRGSPCWALPFRLLARWLGVHRGRPPPRRGGCPIGRRCGWDGRSQQPHASAHGGGRNASSRRSRQRRSTACAGSTARSTWASPREPTAAHAWLRVGDLQRDRRPGRSPATRSSRRSGRSAAGERYLRSRTTRPAAPASEAEELATMRRPMAYWGPDGGGEVA